MKIIDRITEALGLYEEEDELLEETPAQEEGKKSRPMLFAKKNGAADSGEGALAQVKEPAFKKPLFTGKKTAPNTTMSSRTIAMPLADKQVKVVVLEPANFDDSKKIADYLRSSQPVVVNFEGTDNIVTKRMTDFISGTIYALNGSMKKIGRTILVCAPRNVDIDAGVSVYDNKGEQPWKK